MCSAAGCARREFPEDRAYNECFRKELGPAWAQTRAAEIPDHVYTAAIRRCDHLDPFHTTGMRAEERAAAPRDRDGNLLPR